MISVSGHKLLSFAAVLAAGCTWIVAWSPYAGAAAPGQRAKPNIVYLLADDLGIGDLGCYGQKLLKTPNLDRLAADGTRFTDAYAGSMVCAPARCTLMTGKHTGHATVRNNWETYPEGQWPLKPGDVTVAQVLKQAGYATGICGKWGLGQPGSGSTPNDKGFDFFFGYNCQRHAHRYYTDYLYENAKRIDIPQSADHRVYAQDLILQESLDFIRENKDRPFFYYGPWTLPHGPYRTDQVPSLAAYQNTDWSDVQKVYAAMVERYDGDVGRVLDLLKELGLEQDTLVIFASDNGAGDGPANIKLFGSTTGLRAAKGTLWEGGIRAPMIARWPGHVPAGRVSHFPTAFWDFLPTAAELSGAQLPAGVDGVSILPTLLGKPQKREFLYWEQPTPAKLTKAVRMGNWKGYQESVDKPVQLYDLATDRGETKDVAAAHPDVVKNIAALMTAQHTACEIPKADPRIWKKYQEDNKKLDAKFERKAKQ